MGFSPEEDRWLDELGADFLAYVCGVDHASITARLVDQRPLAAAGEEALQGALEFSQVVADNPRPMTLNNRPTYEPLSEALREACARFIPAFGMSYPNALRLASGCQTSTNLGELPAADVAAASVLRDAFPAYLLPRRRSGGSVIERTPTPDFNHPGQSAFFRALADGDPLRRVFPSAEPLSQPPPKEGVRIADVIFARMSYGDEAAISAFQLFEGLAANARERASSRGELTVESFVGAGLETLQEMRLLAAAKEVEIPVILELGAVAAEAGFELETALGTIRASRRCAEPNPFPDHAPAFVGDLLAEVRVPLQMRIVGPARSGWHRGEEAGKWSENLARAMDRMRLALLLSTHGTATRLLSWTICLPIGAPIRSEPQLQSPFPFTRFSSGVVRGGGSNEISIAAQAVAKHHVAALDIATRRVLSAHADRVDPADGLIDSMVALESLFGTGQGEVTLRLSITLARLLETDISRRWQRMRDVKTLYGLRSQISHGGQVRPTDLAQGHERAAALALDVLRCLFFDRPELIAVKKLRELTVMLENENEIPEPEG